MLPIVTIFFFVLTCNLLGMVPWLGSPTGAMGVTGTLALMTFAAVVGAVEGGEEGDGLAGFLERNVEAAAGLGDGEDADVGEVAVADDDEARAVRLDALTGVGALEDLLVACRLAEELADRSLLLAADRSRLLVLGLAAGFAPGPLLVLVISETLQHSTRAGIKVAFAPVITDLAIVFTGAGKKAATAR